MSDGDRNAPFATALRVVLSSHRVSQSDLAAYIGVSVSAISRLCRGNRLPDWGMLARIIDELDLTGTEDEVTLLLAGVASARQREAQAR